ncbi:trypanothione synthetase-like protein [Angomonas deanei]|nr:trypanothione synthetase-like protein [Angomonas deanei]|eukprot:EPY43784.1 trypanothione synthetase-like protein [Angomonas deanei]
MNKCENPNPNYTLPYGEQQGSFKGVVACSNRDDGFFSGENNYVNQVVYTGFRYQCVEYARRFLLLTTGCVFGNCGRSSEIYKMRHITDVETAIEYPLVPHDNGVSTVRPQPGDVILYPFHPELTPWGHVGIISYVNETQVGIIEQNQFFGNFFSPDPNYCDGEPCVARMVDLEHNAETGTYTIVEKSNMPPPLGWMSYETAPKREKMFDPFHPTESMMAVRSTPFDDPRHPRFALFTFGEGIPVPGATVRKALGAVHCGEYMVGAGTAISRVVRYTLQLLLKRCSLGSAFLRLPSNPLQADVSAYANNARLKELFTALEQVGDAHDAQTAEILDKAIATYFDIPVTYVQAMRRECRNGELNLSAACTFTPNFATDEQVSSPVSRIESGGNVQFLYACNPHDEVFSIGKVSFAPPRIFTALSDIQDVAEEIGNLTNFMLQDYRAHASYGFRVDVGRYIKEVEQRRGPRTGLTIVTREHMDSTKREIIQVMESCCEKYHYPIRVVHERELSYGDGKLMAKTEKDTFEANFVFLLRSWEDVLANHEGRHQALYDAALDAASDVVFAQPLWTYLCSGVTNKVDPKFASSSVDGGSSDTKMAANSLKFYDISRYLYTLSQPPQSTDNWDIEISEYKDSCRRVRIHELVKERPPSDLLMCACTINFAHSASMAFHNGRVVDNTNGEYDGQPVGLMHLFKYTEDDD